MQWTEEQKNAIYLKDNNILVAAAAGSGKTAVLVERIINKIVNENIDIDKLLVVTFTNAAASEMRERILKAIYKKQDESEKQEEIESLQKQINLLNKASICTIDSFCLDVIRNNFYELNITPNFRIADTAEIELLKQETLDELFEKKYEEKNEDFQKLIKTYTSYRDDAPLKELILKIYTYIESSPFPEEWLEEKIEMFNIENLNMDFAKTKWGEILLKDINDELIDSIAALNTQMNRLSVEKDLEKFVLLIKQDISQLELLKSNLDSWDKSFSLANSIEFGRWPSNKVLSEIKEKAKKVRDEVKNKLKNKFDKIFISDSKEACQDIVDMYNVLKKLKNVILEFDKEFFKKKQQKNILDFTDIEHLALKILIKKEGDKIIKTNVAKRYEEKFTEIAIDEYQDSNLVQEYILTAVSNGKNIFMVGDVKQSIYKFRQAMPELFLNKYKTYKLPNENLKDIGIKIQLFKNFRSRKNVLDFTNVIFESIMSENLGDINYTEEEYLNLGADFENSKENLSTEIDIINITEETSNDFEINSNTNSKFSNEEDENAEEKEENEKVEDVELEARFVAKKIKELIENRFQIYDNKKGSFRDIKYKDIVILLRSTKIKSPIFEKELVNLDIPVFSDTSSQYLDSFEIKTIMSLLKIIDNPMQDIPLVMVMRSSIGKFTDNELLEIRLAGGDELFYTAILKSRLSVDDSLRKKIDHFLNNIEKWRRREKYLGLDELIWNIYEDTGFLNYVELLPNGNLRKANLQMLFERAKQYESASFKGLFNFINFIEKLSLSSGDLGSAKLIGENQDVVRIMSIHKSKGLEFPIVFLSGTGTSFNLMDLNNDILLHQHLGIGAKYIDYDMQIKYDTLSKMALRYKLHEETLSEEMRVLYVALTRAKEKIFITGIVKKYEDEHKKMQELIDMYKTKNGKINPILLKKYKRYIDWIMLVFMYNKDYMKKNAELNIIKKEELLSKKKKEEQNDKKLDVEKFIQQCIQESNDIEVQKIKKIIEYEYPYLDSVKIPTKTSVTAVVQGKVINNIEYMDENDLNVSNNKFYIEYGDNISNEQKVEMPEPMFLKGTEEEKISSSKKGTLIHLCMKNLDFTKEYDLEKVKKLIDDLFEKMIITEKERDAINPFGILKFTKTGIFKNIKNAKEIHKEEPFYINVKAEDVTKTNAEEYILTQGIIDLYYIDEKDRLILLDYKTDFVREGQEEILIKRHKKQLYLYKEALERALNRKVDKVYIYSVTLGKEIQI